ncbi:putative peptidoglycan lipid II flippase [Bifidobacterium bohemicum]|uniref:Virulence factor MVIN-like protein n=1 Tax=Bifidobacterium bohemicum DSM 22767 TaxID=1437606 RepID=A0A086ZH63_9BIFI|nr:hypothetical protein [Bifidobacterium bohemicum]KFI45863.1 virulence factor MVIN-like protein [Bifidobacterium bohemicum DSM 22767]SCC15837.1 putative peptidoglycan lipid II flippase [Bifidobacterium bohemicum]
MRPQLGDIAINRYTLVSQLRSAAGIEVWKANDRILARDCQLFVVTDETAFSSVEAIASSLALSRNSRFTRIIQMHYVDRVPVLITQLDGGDTLSSYLSDDSHHTLSHNAMRSIVGECAQAAQTLLEDDLTLNCLNTDVVRITSKGVQIADAPVNALLAQKPQIPQPRKLNAEQTVVRQLSLLLYAMVTGRPSSAINGIDLSAMDERTPEEFLSICGRGLTPSGEIKPTNNGKRSDDNHGQKKMPIISLNEFLALLGDWTPMTDLPAEDLTRPTADGQASIVSAALRTPKPKDVLDFPNALFQNQLQFRALQQSSPGQTEHTTTSGPNKTEASTPDELPAPSGSGTPSAQSRHHKWWNHHRDASPRSEDAPVPGRPFASELPSPDLHDLTAAEVAGAFKPLDPLADNDLFGEFNQVPGSSANETMHFDFSTTMHGAPDVSGGQSHGLEATSRIPLFDSDGEVIEPGQESARALAAEEQAQADAPAAALPPSFIPQQNAHNTAQREESEDDESIADTPILGKLTTKVVAIVIVALLIITAACTAFYALGKSHGTAEYKQTSSNPWPNMNLNDVPFGDQGNGGETAPDQSKNPGNPSSPNSPSGQTASNADGQSGSKGRKRAVSATKNAGRVPAPAIPANTTPFAIDKQEFLENPSGQSGLAYYIHLQQPESAYRFVIHARSSGGKGHLIAGTTKDPTQGQELVEFTFDANGTTDVKFKQQSKTQDYMLWVPMDSLPGNQLYIDKVQLY